MVLEGWLLKKGEKKKGITGSTRMRKRFFKQRGKYLYYYKSEEDVINPLGIIDISEIKEIINVDGKPAFDVITPERTFHLVVADAKNPQYWIDGLHKSQKEIELESKTESADANSKPSSTTSNDQESKLAQSLPKKSIPGQVVAAEDDASRPKSGTLPLSYGSPRFKPEKPKAESLFAKPKNPSPFARPSSSSSSSSSDVPSFANPTAKTKKIKDILDDAPHSPSPFSSPAVEVPESVPPQLVGATFNNPRPNAKPSPPIPNSPQAFTSGGVTKPVPQFNRIGSSSTLNIPMRVSPLAAAQSQPLLPAAVVYSPPAPARGNRDGQKEGIPSVSNGSGEDKSYEQMSIEILLKRINQLSEETKDKEEKLGKVSAEHRRAISAVTDKLKSLSSARETEKAVWNGRVSQIEKENEAMKEEMKLVGEEIRREYQEMLKLQEEGMKELEGIMGDYEKSDDAGKAGLKIRIEMKEKELENTKKLIVSREKIVLGMEERMRDNWH